LVARPPHHGDPIEEARKALQQLRDAPDWDEPTPVVHVNVQAPARRTSPPAPPPAPPAGTLQIVVQGVGGVFQRLPKWGAVIVAVVAIIVGAWVYLAIHGKAPSP
jgi:hypothetical protein